MARGMLFCADSLVACTILLSCLLLLSSAADSLIARQLSEAKEKERVLFALALSEAIVKNRNTNEPERGAAYFDQDKKRAEANVVEESLLADMKPRSFGGYELAGIYKRNAGGVHYYFRKDAQNCLAIERFVIVKGLTENKEVLGVVACDK